MTQARPDQHNGCYLRVPGLLGPVPADARELVHASLAMERLAGLLSRARLTRRAEAVTGIPGFTVEPSDRALPAGPLALLGTGGVPGDDYWFRADPVHLLADRDQLRLLGPETLDIDQEEARQLARAFNDYFRDDGLELVTPLPDAWFLRCSTPPRVQTVPLHTARDVPLGPVQPRGEDASWWQARLNETQMLFHGHAVNQNRERQGSLLVNGIWPWGGGVLPRVSGRWNTVFADDPLVRGLGVAAGLVVGHWPREAEPVLQAAETGRTLAVAPELPVVRDGESFQAWEAAVQDFCEAWAAPLERTLRQRRCASLTLDAGHEGAPRRLTPASRLAFWRRRRSFVSLLASA